MPLLALEQIEPMFICPRCRAPLEPAGERLACTNAGCTHAAPLGFRRVGQWPVLVDFEHSILSEVRLSAGSAASPVVRGQPTGVERWLRNVLQPPNGVARDQVARLVTLARDAAEAPIVLVVGGGAVGSGIEAVYADPSLRLIGFDIYASPWVQFVGDGHRIPLADASVDAVIVQAVLEHVLTPSQVVSEIHRVLKRDGLVYGDTPFLQPVHEGPFDFTRFTDSGHRYLFKQFSRIDSGAVGGPGAQLSGSLDHLARGLFRSRAAGRLARGAFSWARALDRVIPAPYALDAATGVFFLGRKSDREITPREMVDYYRGQQRLNDSG